MKKFTIALGVLFGLIILAAFILPVILKPKIKAAIDKALKENINANVYYDGGSLSVSLIRKFPNISVGLSTLGISGNATFEGDTLVHMDQFSITLDIMSVIRGKTLEIVSVQAINPRLNILVLADGRANYDIAIPSEEIDEEESSDLSIIIKEWQLENADIVYYDASLPFYTTLFGLNHTGSGDFSQSVFDMKSQSEVRSFSVSYDDIEYITDKYLDADITMEMDLENWKFTFKENVFHLNGVTFSFDGFLEMPTSDIAMDLNFAGQELDLKSVMTLTPGAYDEYLEGVAASGVVSMDGYIRGIFTDSLMPATYLAFEVKDGGIKHADAPAPLENIQFKAVIDIPTADWREASFTLSPFSMTMQNEPFSASILVSDFEDYGWDIKAKGKLDLEKVMKIFPIADTKIKGIVNMDLATTGKYSDVEAKRYDKLPTSGNLKLTGFYYKSSDLLQGLGINKATVSFNPKSIIVDEFEAVAGASDFQVKGNIENYLGYALSDSETLKGKFSLTSNVIDINEWMVASDETETDTTAMEVIRIPGNLDFLFTAVVKQMVYDGMSMTDFNGAITIKDGKLDLQKTSFSLMGGKIQLSGSYNSVPELPAYDFAFDIKDMPFADAFNSFETVKKLTPFAEKMTGDFSTKLRVGGLLAGDMSPIYESMSGSGLVNVVSAAIQDVQLLSAISSISSLKANDGNINIRNMKLQLNIADGFVNVKPFDVVLGGYTTTIEGSNSVEGKLFYTMKLKNVETGSVGQAISSTIGSLTGIQGLVSDKIDINLGVEGDFKKPQVKLLGVVPAGTSGGKGAMTDAAKEALKNKINQEKAAMTEKLSETKQMAKDSLTRTVGSAKDSLSTMVGDAKDQAKDAAETETEKAKEKASEAAKNLLKKKKGGNE